MIRHRPLAIADDLMESLGSGPLRPGQPAMIGECRASEKSLGRSSNDVSDTFRMHNHRLRQHNLRTAARDRPSSRQRY
jgi:hypothetical protein